MAQFIQLIILGLLVGSLYALIGIGLVLIYRSSGVLNFAQGYLVMIGAMFVWSFAGWLAMPIVPSILLGLGGAWLLGMLIERLAVRPLLGQPILSTIVMTLALSLVLMGIATVSWGPLGLSYPSKIFPEEMWHLGAVWVPQLQFWTLVVTGAILGGLLFYCARSKSGLAMQAIADDTQCSRTLGVKATSVLSLSWALSAIVAAMGGYFIGNMIGLEVLSMPMFGFKAIAAMIVGGMESLTGVLCGGLLIGIAEYMACGYLDPWLAAVGWGGGIRDVFPFVVLVMVLLVKPYGFFGWKRIERV